MDRIEHAVERLMSCDLSRAAYIVQDWAVQLVLTKLASRSASAGKLLLTSLANEQAQQVIQGHENVLQWSEIFGTDHLASLAVEELIDVVEHRRSPQCVHLTGTCKLADRTSTPRIVMTIERRTFKPQIVHQPQVAAAIRQ